MSTFDNTNDTVNDHADDYSYDPAEEGSTNNVTKTLVENLGGTYTDLKKKKHPNMLLISEQDHYFGSKFYELTFPSSAKLFEFGKKEITRLIKAWTSERRLDGCYYDGEKFTASSSDWGYFLEFQIEDKEIEQQFIQFLLGCHLY